MTNLANKIKDYREVKQTLRNAMSMSGHLSRELFETYLEKRNAYEEKYNERFKLLEEPKQ